MIRRRAIRLASLALPALTVGCTVVSPRVPDGEPAPDLVVTFSESSPVTGEMGVTAIPTNFSPTSVTFRIGGSSVEVVDPSAPFEATLDTTQVADGLRILEAVGTDGTYTVTRFESFVVRNRPNFVLVLLDDLDAATTDVWSALPQTEALLADQGLSFTNSFVTDPICCPARASLLTGRYPHNTGVFDNTPPDGGAATFAGAAEQDTVATRLAQAGYATAFVGKYLNGYGRMPTHVPPGWSEWFGLTASFYDGYTYSANHNGTTVSFGSSPADYQTDVLGNVSLEFLESTERRDHQPFFLLVAPSAPHHPMPPAPRHSPNPFAGEALPTRPNVDEPDVSDKPTWLRDGNPPLTPQLAGFNTNDYQRRLGSLLAVDDLIAALLARLEANGELDHTIVVFTSDNGYNLGAHRLLAKQAPYEESIRVPLVVRGPGVRVGDEAALVTNLDLAPTFLQLAQLDASDLDGASLEPLLRGDDPTWRDGFLVEFNGTYEPNGTDYDTLAQVEAGIVAGDRVSVPTYRAVRTTDWLFVEWYGGDEHEYELYDLATDPYQLDNLVATPEGLATHAATVALLQDRLDELSTCTAASCR